MGNGIFSAVSGSKAQGEYLDVIANNLANANTVGYKADELRFGEHITKAKAETGGTSPILDNEPPQESANLQKRSQIFTKVLGTFTDWSQGGLRRTGNDLDLALKGEGFFKIQKEGKIFYTRDGQFKLGEDGQLQHASGDPVLDDGDSPIRVEDGRIRIGEDGTVFQEDREVARIGVFTVPDKNAMKKAGSNLYEYQKERTAPPEEASETKVLQGHLERSNINPIREMVKMINANRHFDTINKAIQSYKSMDERSIRDVATSGN